MSQELQRHPVQQLNAHGYVIAGGASRRFGTDKARAVHDGRTLLEGAAGVLRDVGVPVTVVCAPGRTYEDLGLRCIEDLRPGDGPLSALHAALTDRADGWVALVACDLVGARPEWLRVLAERAGDAPAVAFRAVGIWQPVFALYSTELLPEVERRLDRGLLAARRLLDDVALAVDPPPGFSRMRSVDTPQALDEIGNDE